MKRSKMRGQHGAFSDTPVRWSRWVLGDSYSAPWRTEQVARGRECLTRCRPFSGTHLRWGKRVSWGTCGHVRKRRLVVKRSKMRGQHGAFSDTPVRWSRWVLGDSYSAPWRTEQVARGRECLRWCRPFSGTHLRWGKRVSWGTCGHIRKRRLVVKQSTRCGQHGAFSDTPLRWSRWVLGEAWALPQGTHTPWVDGWRWFRIGSRSTSTPVRWGKPSNGSSEQTRERTPLSDARSSRRALYLSASAFRADPGAWCALLRGLCGGRDLTAAIDSSQRERSARRCAATRPLQDLRPDEELCGGTPNAPSRGAGFLKKAAMLPEPWERALLPSATGYSAAAMSGGLLGGRCIEDGAAPMSVGSNKGDIRSNKGDNRVV